MISDKLIKLATPIKMLLLDVDGVLTTGNIIYNEKGLETKIFNVKDGLGIRLLMDAGIKIGIVTGRSSDALISRCENLGIDLLYDGVSDKEAVLETIISENKISHNEIAFAGDDLPDIRIMKKSGFPIAVADASPEVREAAAYITSAKGGTGAVREICELILKAKGLWSQTIERFL